MAAREAIAATAAVTLIPLAIVPYSPTSVYEGRYLIVVFANEIPDGPIGFSAHDVGDGAQVAGYFHYRYNQPLKMADGRGWGGIFYGAWRPSHGPWPLLPSGYPAPYLVERAVRVEGGPFEVRVWEGAGVQRECDRAFEGAGLNTERHTGGGQGWGPHGYPMGFPDDSQTRAQSWDSTRFLTCVWVDNVGPVRGDLRID